MLEKFYMFNLFYHVLMFLSSSLFIIFLNFFLEHFMKARLFLISPSNPIYNVFFFILELILLIFFLLLMFFFSFQFNSQIENLLLPFNLFFILILTLIILITIFYFFVFFFNLILQCFI